MSETTSVKSIDDKEVKKLCQDYANYSRVNLSEEHGQVLLKHHHLIIYIICIIYIIYIIYRLWPTLQQLKNRFQLSQRCWQIFRETSEWKLVFM